MVDSTVYSSNSRDETFVSSKTCSKCGQVKEMDDFHSDMSSPDKRTRQCKKCRLAKKREAHSLRHEKAKEYSRLYRDRNRDALIQKSRDYHQSHADQINAHKRKYFYALKIEVIRAYGGCCYMSGKDGISCGNNRLDMLTIDHVNQDAAHRRKHDPDHPDRENVYSWLRTQRYPPGFRVACMNHNRLAWIESIAGNHLSANRKSRELRDRNLWLKHQVIEILGGACVVCGETDSRILTLHHVNGGGRQHVAQFKSKTLGLYRYLVKTPIELWEHKLECRCYNCNVAEEWGRTEGYAR